MPSEQKPAVQAVLVSLLVLLETERVLQSRYELAKAEIVAAFSALLDTADLAFEDEPSVEHAVYSWIKTMYSPRNAITPQ
jgi:predicted nucleic-acid-binding protein